MPLLVFVLAVVLCTPAVAVEVYAPPSTSRMSALDRENDVVIPPAPPPPSSPVIEALPLALGTYGVTAVLGMGAVYVAVTSARDSFSSNAVVAGAIAVTSLAPVVAVGAVAHDVPWPVWPAMAVGTASGTVVGSAAGIVTSFVLLVVVRPSGTDCLGCSPQEAVAMLVPPLLGAGIGGAVGLTTTMFIASAFVPAPGEP
jgi:hypothetical protein